MLKLCACHGVATMVTRRIAHDYVHAILVMHLAELLAVAPRRRMVSG
jgi:hypothetical protein